MTNPLIQQLKKWLQQANRETVNLDVTVDYCYETFVKCETGNWPSTQYLNPKTTVWVRGILAVFSFSSLLFFFFACT